MNLYVGLNVMTIPYKDSEGTTYWYEGTIMKIDKKSADIRPFADGVPIVEGVPIEDIAYVITGEKITKGGKTPVTVPVSEFSPKKTGRKLKPDGTKLPDDYGTQKYYERTKEELE